jgi:predicted polyphosphate/ATP-dependent NAD kinase
METGSCTCKHNHAAKNPIAIGGSKIKETKKRIGFIINPFAGLGGSVGLKGTDGLAVEALKRGAVPVSSQRARRAVHAILQGFKGDGQSVPLFLTASDSMGEDLMRELGLEHRVVHLVAGTSHSLDTSASVSAFSSHGAELILFCGGDGTARDVAESAAGVPILGIPAGVKMHSGVFAVSPEAAGELAARFVKGELALRDAEIVDVDEEMYRKGELCTKLYSIVRTPYEKALVQERKQVYSSADEEWHKMEIAQFAVEFMRDGSAYILGAGTTTAGIAQLLGIKKTLLGIDIVRNGEVVLSDAGERDLLMFLDRLEAEAPFDSKKRVKILLSPIGAQGFILGRGSQQISPAVLSRVGLENLIILATPHKLQGLPYLLVDTGDRELDMMAEGSRQVIVGYRLAQRKQVRAAFLVSGFAGT